MEKGHDKTISQQQHHPCLDVAVRKLNSPCRYADEVANHVAAIIISLIGTIMDRPNSTFLLAITEEQEKVINPQYVNTNNLDMGKLHPS